MSSLLAKIFPYLLALMEALLLLGGVILTLALARRGRRPPAGLLRVDRTLARIGNRRRLAILICTLAPILIRLALVPVLGIPEPRWNDEQSYLLAADTFASGRITNPAHPMWVFFETFHVLQHPTYQSMYPPGQGLLLALGMKLGHPWIGVLLAGGLFCGVLCWMLQGWLPARWAFYGGLLAVLRLEILSYWMNSYFGTSLPALAGALLLGAWPRIRDKASLKDSILVGIGLALLANTRPYDGLVLSIPVAVALGCWLLRNNTFPIATRFWRVLLPLACVLIFASGLTGYYNWRLTGGALRLGYQASRENVAPTPYFLFLKPRPIPEYHHRELRDFYVGFELREFLEAQSLAGFLRLSLHKMIEQWHFYLATVLTLPFLALPWLVKDPRLRFPWIIAGAVALGAFVETWTLPHYLAPASSLIYLFLIHGIRRLRFWRWRHDRLGAALVRLIPMISILMILLRVVAVPLRIPLEAPWPRGDLTRARLLHHLESNGEKHLVIVRYGAHHAADEEWVYNRADIDHAAVIWARDMGTAQNKPLLDYFSDRHTWLLQPDQDPLNLVEYSATHGGSQSTDHN